MLTSTYFSIPLPSSEGLLSHVMFRTRTINEAPLQLHCSYKIHLKCYYNKIQF